MYVHPEYFQYKCRKLQSKLMQPGPAQNSSGLVTWSRADCSKANSSLLSMPMPDAGASSNHFSPPCLIGWSCVGSPLFSRCKFRMGCTPKCGGQRPASVLGHNGPFQQVKSILLHGASSGKSMKIYDPMIPISTAELHSFSRFAQGKSKFGAWLLHSHFCGELQLRLWVRYGEVSMLSGWHPVTSSVCRWNSHVWSWTPPIFGANHGKSQDPRPQTKPSAADEATAPLCWALPPQPRGVSPHPGRCARGVCFGSRSGWKDGWFALVYKM